MHIVLSYRICRDTLKADELHTLKSITASSANVLGFNIFSVGPAYRELKKDWFGDQNIFLEDAQVHIQHKEAWMRQTASLSADFEPQIRRIARDFITSTFLPGKKIDLYETLKTLVGRLLLNAFLALDADENKEIFEKIEQAQETLLRGQFSLSLHFLSTPSFSSQHGVEVCELGNCSSNSCRNTSRCRIRHGVLFCDEQKLTEMT